MCFRHRYRFCPKFHNLGRLSRRSRIHSSCNIGHPIRTRYSTTKPPTIVVNITLPAIELVGPRHRTLVTILVNIAYSLALVSLSIIVWAVRDWRLLALATTLPFVTLFFHWWLLPESPRWLLAQGRVKEAEKILVQMARYSVWFVRFQINDLDL
jgi:hypothetical protein